jgi:hypothetical protein
MKFIGTSLFLGRRGHPPLLSSRLILWIMQSDGCDGLRHVLERYDQALERYGADPKARNAIGERRQRAHKVAARVESAMGRTLADVAVELSA